MGVGGVGGRVASGVKERSVEVGKEGGHSGVDPNVGAVLKAWFLMFRRGAESRGFENLVCVITHVVVLVVVVTWAPSGVAAIEVEGLVTSLAECVRGVEGKSKA